MCLAKNPKLGSTSPILNPFVMISSYLWAAWSNSSLYRNPLGTGWLVSENPAKSCWNPRWAAWIRSDSECAGLGRYENGFSTWGAAADEVGVVRIKRSPKDRIARVYSQQSLRHVRMRKRHASLAFQQFHHIRAKGSRSEIVCKATGLYHSFNFEVVLYAEGQAVVRSLLEDPFQANICQPIELSDGWPEAACGEGVEILLARSLQQFLDFLI